QPVHHPRAYRRSLATRRTRPELSPGVREDLPIVKRACYELVVVEAGGIGQGHAAIEGGSDSSHSDEQRARRARPARESVHDLQAGLVGESLQDLGLAPEEVVAIAVLADTVVKNTDWVPTVLVPTVPANTVVATRHGSSITLGTIARSHRHASAC